MENQKLKLDAEKRNDFGKGFARRARKNGNVPAVIYSKGEENKHILINSHDANLALRHTNALIDINLGDEKIQVLPRALQRNVVTNNLEHVDFIIVKKGATVRVSVPIELIGEPVSPAIAIVNYQTVELDADISNIPEKIEVSVEGLNEGDAVKSTDIKMPEGSKFITDEEFTIVSITVPKEEVEEEKLKEETEESADENASKKESDSKSDDDSKNEESSDDKDSNKKE